ncbi:MAG: type II secretion system F family protein [Actinomycetia bacterium]|nr:type II secretion system F family protein [Actinomycetes bacterium]MCP4084539.1 type II secretion system F family protein [Actinomycetes bacterium]
MTAIRTTQRGWNYQAVGVDGEIVQGRVGAGTENDAAAAVRRMGLRPVSLTSDSTSAWKREISLPGNGKAVKPGDLAVAIRQLATMVGAGVPLLRVVSVLSDQADSPRIGAAFAGVRHQIESGASLSEAAARHPEVFDPLMVSVMRAGEVSGALDQVLDQMAIALERTASVRRKVRSVLAYPLAVLVLVFLVLAAMTLFVIPVFQGIYDDLGSTLPLPTAIVVGVSSFVTGNLPLVVLGGGGAVFGFNRWRRSPAGRRALSAIALRTPVLGALISRSALARMTRTLSVLLGAGVPMMDALDITGEAVGNQKFAAALSSAKDGVRSGQSLGSALEATNALPAMLIQMVEAGEQSGRLEQMLDALADHFEEEVDSAAASFSSVVEPVLMAVLGTTVGGLVISLYLPLFRVIDLVQ